MIRLQVDQKVVAQRLLFYSFELELQKGELLCLLGPSGCGKTTLLNMIAGLDNNFDGLLQQDVSAADDQNGVEVGEGAMTVGKQPSKQQDRQPQAISYMFQQPRLLPWRTVRQNLQLVIDADRYHRIEPLLASMGLAGSAELYPSALSVGMERRVALARSLIVDPQLILMDEPFVSLDPPTATEMRQQVRRIRQQRPDTSILFVTHDLREAISLADRILILGGDPTRVLHQWHSEVLPEQRDHHYVAAQERLLLDHYQRRDCDWSEAAADVGRGAAVPVV
ncbi:MAG: ATP-binding cassette domain-containing protein [Motiliproteus sp.]